MRSTLPTLLLLCAACSAPSADFTLGVSPTSIDLFPEAQRSITIRGEWSGELPPQPIQVDPRNWPPELGAFPPFELTPDAPAKTVTINFPQETEPGQRLSPLVARSRGAVKWQVLDFLVRAASGALDRSFGEQGTARFCDDGGPNELLGMSLEVPDSLLLFGRSSSELVIAQTLPSGAGPAAFLRREVSALPDLLPKVLLFEKDRSRTWVGAESSTGVLLSSASYEDPFNTMPTTLERKDLKSLGAGALSSEGLLLAAATRAVPGELAVLRLDRQGRPLLFTAPKSELAKAALSGEVRPMSIYRNANGRFLVGGSAGGGAFIARFQPNGNLDTSFGLAGVFWLPPVGGEVHEVIEGSSGGVWFSGVSRGLSFVGRLTDRGALDASFGQGGVNRLVEATYGRVLLAEAPELGVYVAMSLRASPADADFAVAALNRDGTFKTTFGNAGWRVTPVGQGNDTLMAFEAISNRTLLLAGTTENRCFGLARIWQ